MLKTTLCYIEQDGKYLMLYRNKKRNDPSAGKWIGVGGKLEPGETPAQCVLRETKEETGLTLINYRARGVIYFYSNLWEPEIMYLYSADRFTGSLYTACNEGELRWVPFSEIMDLQLWEGDRIFLQKLLDGNDDICLTLRYEGDTLVSVSGS